MMRDVISSTTVVRSDTPDPEPKRMAVIRVDVAVLAAALHLPDGVEVVDASRDPDLYHHGHILVKVAGPGLPSRCAVQPGHLLAEVMPFIESVLKESVWVPRFGGWVSERKEGQPGVAVH